MRNLIVLIVPDNDRQFGLLSRAIRGVGVGDIKQASGAEEAVRWSGPNDCDACVISYELPGKRNGLDTLLHMRTQRPDLPVIMVSKSGSERVAVAAFHAGAVDYVPIAQGYEQAVASLISQIKVSTAGGSIIPAQIIPPNVEDSVLRPSYQNRLRVIGRYLDLYGYKRVNILEVEGGFIVRATSSDSRSTETLEFVSQQFAQLIATAVAARGEGERRISQARPLLPTGYEDFLRAVGYRLDEHAAEAVTMSELDEIAIVGGVGRVDETGASRFGPIQWLFRPSDVSVLLDEAYRRRRDIRPERSAEGSSVLRRLTSNA